MQLINDKINEEHRQKTGKLLVMLFKLITTLVKTDEVSMSLPNI